MSDKLENAASPGLFRVFSSMFYDLWLVLAICMLGVTIDAFIWDLPPDERIQGSHFLLQAYLLIAPMFFFTWFWTHGGQSLGMRSWRIRVVTLEGNTISWQQAIIRYLAAFLSAASLGLGFLWIWIDNENRSWHDRLSNTRLVVTEKPKK